MIGRIFKASILFVAVVTVSCNRTPESLTANEYSTWISSEERGFVKQKKVKTVTMTARYLPAQFLAYRDFSNENNSGSSYDSIYNFYRCGLTFQFSLQADKLDEEYGNLKYYDIRSEEELMGRVRFLSFSTTDFFEAQWNNETFYPVLGAFEGFDELENRLTFTAVFQIADFNCGNPPENFDNVTFTFEDPLWGMGINHFVFQKPVFDNKPKLQL